MKTGIELIAEERARQISSEGWAAAHDDQYTGEQLAEAAVCYATPKQHRRFMREQIIVEGVASIALIPAGWPWDARWWKPTEDDRLRELAKAGALIAAQMDKILRAEEVNTPHEPCPQKTKE